MKHVMRCANAAGIMACRCVTSDAVRAFEYTMQRVDRIWQEPKLMGVLMKRARETVERLGFDIVRPSARPLAAIWVSMRGLVSSLKTMLRLAFLYHPAHYDAFEAETGDAVSASGVLRTIGNPRRICRMRCSWKGGATGLMALLTRNRECAGTCTCLMRSRKFVNLMPQLMGREL